LKTKTRKQRERERLKQNKERLAFLGTLASGLAHEIRTPLNAMKLNAELMAEDARHLPEEIRGNFEKRIDRVVNECSGLQKILDSFLIYARPPQIDAIPTGLNVFLHETVELLRPECLQQSIEIIERFEDNLFPVAVDQRQLNQVIMNLIINARDAIGEQGTITVSTRSLENEVEVAVEDNGGGIPEGEEEKIFDIFYTTKEKGTGLGLAIARRIINEHNGTLVVENSPGKGARFVIHLPRPIILSYEEDRKKQKPK